MDVTLAGSGQRMASFPEATSGITVNSCCGNPRISWSHQTLTPPNWCG